MIFYDLFLELKDLWCIFDYDKSVSKVKEIDEILSKNDVFLDSIYLERSNLLKKINRLMYFNTGFSDLLELFNLAKNDADTAFLNELSISFKKLKTEFFNFEVEVFFSSKRDCLDAFLDITAGSGGIESQDWVGMLFKMYVGWAGKNNFRYCINSVTYGEVTGFKNISITVSGKYAFGFLKYESGVHRLVRKSPFDSNNKRHTSFASVFVYPVLEFDNDIKLIDSDLRIDTYKSSGAGGQHVNTTESAVRIIHIPTNIVVQCQSERSQHQNRAQAIKQLKSKLRELKLSDEKKAKQKIEQSKMSISWGSQIRSYILDKSVIKDLRTNVEIFDIDLVLSGYLEPFILSMLDFKSDLYE